MTASAEQAQVHDLSPWAPLRNKIFFTLAIIAVYRLGAHIPVPYVDFSAIKDLQDQANNSEYGPYWVRPPFFAGPFFHPCSIARSRRGGSLVSRTKA